MRTDQSLNAEIRDADAWEQIVPRSVALLEIGEAVTQNRIDGLKSSFSGYERNRLFLSEKAKAFHDVSGVSGLDSEKDGRVFVKWDYDRDGWIDLAVTNTNRPLVNVYRNELGAQGEPGQFLAIRFVGGNGSATPSDQYSSRDAYGARAYVNAGDLNIVREHHCGEGMAAQNSATLLIGIADKDQADLVSIRWPSGKTQELSNVKAGSLVTFFENPQESPNDTGFEVTDYRRQRVVVQSVKPQPKSPELTDLFARLKQDSTDTPTLHVFTSTASWCPSCKKALPQWEQLKSQFGSNEIALHAIPIDTADDRQKLEDYIQRNDPAYDLVIDTPEADRMLFQEKLVELLGRDVLPTSIITDENYQVLMVTAGAPTVSQIKEARRLQDVGTSDSN